MKKRNLVLALAMAAAMTTAAACGGSSAPAAATTAASAATTAAAAETKAADTKTAETKADAAKSDAKVEASLETPAVLTSIGQSADVDIVKTLCTKAGLTIETNGTLKADDLPADCKTLILAVGGSSKGLGAAGIDADGELARTKALLEKAKSQGTKVLAMHTGGSARRGTLSDSFIKPAFEAADVAIVVSEGDSDGLMKGIIDGNGAQGVYVDKITDVLTTLQGLFGVSK
ncbi:MAG: DUF6305 family protein [Clostridium sp.]|nr:DUF6305 family protein [Clostridium sp.]